MKKERKRLQLLRDRALMDITPLTGEEQEELDSLLNQERKERILEETFNKSFWKTEKKCERDFVQKEDINICISGANKMLDSLKEDMIY